MTNELLTAPPTELSQPHRISPESREAFGLPQLVLHSAAMIAVIDSETRLKTANPAGETLTGWRVADMVGARMIDLVHPDDLDVVAAAIEDVCAASGRVVTLVFRLALAHGGWIHLSAVATNMIESPEVQGISVLACTTLARSPSPRRSSPSPVGYPRRSTPS